MGILMPANDPNWNEIHQEHFYDCEFSSNRINENTIELIIEPIEVYNIPSKYRCVDNGFTPRGIVRFYSDYYNVTEAEEMSFFSNLDSLILERLKSICKYKEVPTSSAKYKCTVALDNQWYHSTPYYLYQYRNLKLYANSFLFSKTRFERHEYNSDSSGRTLQKSTAILALNLQSFGKKKIA